MTTLKKQPLSSSASNKDMRSIKIASALMEKPVSEFVRHVVVKESEAIILSHSKNNASQPDKDKLRAVTDRIDAATNG